MKDSIFWRVIGVGTVVGLLWIGYGLGKNSQIPPPSFSSVAYGEDAKPGDEAKPALAPPAPPFVEKSKLVFKSLGRTSSSYGNPMFLARAKVTGGWIFLLRTMNVGDAITFYPDPKHEWNGDSMD